MAFHSPLLDPVLEPFAAVANTVQLHAARIPMISTRTGLVAGADEMANATYWVRQLRETCSFQHGAADVLHRGVDALIEIGPQRRCSISSNPQIRCPIDRSCPRCEKELMTGGNCWRVFRVYLAGGV
jgi:acyl transferase domain-containing protein